jgi:hypothetical protein
MSQVRRILDQIRAETQRKDSEWRVWIKQPESIMDCLRDPDLLKPPSERPSKPDRGQDILLMIKNRPKNT